MRFMLPYIAEVGPVQACAPDVIVTDRQHYFVRKAVARRELGSRGMVWSGRRTDTWVAYSSS